MNSTVKPNQQINLTQHFEYILRIGDSVLILGHRLSEWCGHSPVIEEDLAITNVALDLIGQARALLSHAASIEGNARDEDQLAYLRSPDEIKNVTIVELPNEHFGVTILRNFLFLSFQRELWKSLKGTSDHQRRFECFGAAISSSFCSTVVSFLLKAKRIMALNIGATAQVIGQEWGETCDVR